MLVFLRLLVKQPARPARMSTSPILILAGVNYAFFTLFSKSNNLYSLMLLTKDIYFIFIEKVKG